MSGARLIDSMSGPARKYYRLTAAGRQALDDSLAAWSHLMGALQPLLSAPIPSEAEEAMGMTSDTFSGRRRRAPIRACEGGLVGPGFELRAHGATVGAIRPHHPLTRRSQIDIPELALPIQVFLAALVAFMWNRDASAAAGA